MSRDRGGLTAGGRPPEVTGSHARPPAPGLSGGTGLFPGEGAGCRASRGFAPSPNHGEGAASWARAGLPAPHSRRLHGLTQHFLRRSETRSPLPCPGCARGSGLLIALPRVTGRDPSCRGRIAPTWKQVLGALPLELERRCDVSLKLEHSTIIMRGLRGGPSLTPDQAAVPPGDSSAHQVPSSGRWQEVVHRKGCGRASRDYSVPPGEPGAAGSAQTGAPLAPGPALPPQASAGQDPRPQLHRGAPQSKCRPLRHNGHSQALGTGWQQAPGWASRCPLGCQRLKRRIRGSLDQGRTVHAGPCGDGVVGHHEEGGARCSAVGTPRAATAP